MRREYDFSDAVRGMTAARYAEGVNIVVVDPEVLDVFPDSAAVNDTLRALAPIMRHRRKRKGTARPARRSSRARGAADSGSKRRLGSPRGG